MPKFYLPILFSFFLYSCHSPKNEPFDRLIGLLDQRADICLQNGHAPDIALGVYRDGKVYHNYYGSSHRSEGLSDSSLFEIASITKIFTGSLAARAVLDGKINLEDDIRMYLRGEYPYLEFESEPIRIWHLLTHTMGFENRRPPGYDRMITQITKGKGESSIYTYTMDDLLEEMKEVRLDKKPGTFYEYNSIGAELVSYILQRVYERSYEELLSDFMVEIGMRNSVLVTQKEKEIDHLVRGYDEEGRLAQFDGNPLIGGGFGLLATLPDLMKLVVFQLESQDPLIKEATRVLYEDEEDNRMGYLWQDMGIGEEEGFYYSKTGTSNPGLLSTPPWTPKNHRISPRANHHPQIQKSLPFLL